VEIHRYLARAIRQPIRDQAAQQGIPLLLQLRNALWRQLLGQIAAHSIGVRRVLQVGTGRFDSGVVRGSRQQQAPQIGGLTAITVRSERNVLLADDHGIM
jgi:hypothetical protein